MNTISPHKVQPLPSAPVRARAFDRLANLIAEAAEMERDHNTQRYLWTASADLFSAAGILRRRGHGQ